MMRKTKLAILAGALLSSLLGTAVAVPTAVDRPAVAAATTTSDRLARRGADDPAPPPGCDDHGTDLCAATFSVARKGADDPTPPGCDDHGSDLCRSGG